MNLGKIVQFGILALCLTACGGGGGGSDSGGPGGPTPTADTTPDGFIFKDIEKAPTDSLITSEPVTITGINSTTVIAIEGGQYSINGGSFVDGSGSVSNNDKVRVQLRSSSDLDSTTSAKLTVGGISDEFNVLTRSDETPPTASIVFPALQDTWVYQSEVIIRGTAADNRGIEGVYVNDALADTADNFSNWQLQVSVAEPSTEFVVKVVDVDGNETALQPLRVNAHDGYAPRAFGALAIDVSGGRLFAGPRPTRIELSDFKFQRYASSDLIVTEMAFDATRKKWYGATSDYLAELSPETGEVLEQYEASTSYASSMDIDEVSGKIYLNNSGWIEMLDPATNAPESISGPSRGSGQELEPDAKIVINNQTIYAISDSINAGHFESSLITIDPATGNRSLHTNLYETSEKITRAIAAVSHPNQPLIYFLAKSELADDGAENLYSFNLGSREILKVFDMADAEDISADFGFSHMQIDHISNVIYVLTSSSNHLYKIDLNSGGIAQVSPGFRGTGTAMPGDFIRARLEYDIANKRLATLASSTWSDAGGKLVTVEIDSGDRQIASGPSRGAGVAFFGARDFSISGAGDIFVADYGDETIKSVDSQSGDRNVVTGDGVGCCTVFEVPTAVEVDPLGKTAVAINSADQLLTVDLTTGNREILSDDNLSTGAGPAWNGLHDIEADFDRGVVYALGWPSSGTAALYEVSLDTGDRKILVSGESGIEFPDSNRMFYDAGENKLLFPTRFESAGYFEYDLEKGLMAEKPYLGTDVAYSISAFAKVGNRLFAKASNPNFVAEIDEQTGSLVIISE